MSDFFYVVELAMTFTGVIISIIEVGLLFYIIRTSHRKNTPLKCMLLLAILWGSFLLCDNLGEYTLYRNLMLLAGIVSTIAILIFLSALKILKRFYNNFLLFSLGIVSSIAVIFQWVSYYIPSADELASIFAFIPTVIGYVMFMEAVIRTKNEEK